MALPVPGMGDRLIGQTALIVCLKPYSVLSLLVMLIVIIDVIGEYQSGDTISGAPGRATLQATP